MTDDGWGDCDAGATATGYYNPDTGVWTCRCVICAHCNKHTGNSHQGHYWSYCMVTKSVRDFHFCCPTGCSLENDD